MFRRLRVAVCLLLLVELLLLPVAVCAGGKGYQRSFEQYVLPNVTLVNQDGARVPIKKMVESDKLVVVQFIFATCTTICPVLSSGYVNLQRRLGQDRDKVHLVSISIDPENDTPEVMRQYLQRYRSLPGWDFLTGSREDIDNVMRAFDAYITNKMSHSALTFIHAPREGQWLKLGGILSSAEFEDEVKKAVSR